MKIARAVLFVVLCALALRAQTKVNLSKQAQGVLPTANGGLGNNPPPTPGRYLIGDGAKWITSTGPAAQTNTANLFTVPQSITAAVSGTDSWGLKIGTLTDSAASVYGLWILDQTAGTNDWNIWSGPSTVPSTFGEFSWARNTFTDTANGLAFAALSVADFGGIGSESYGEATGDDSSPGVAGYGGWFLGAFSGSGTRSAVGQEVQARNIGIGTAATLAGIIIDPGTNSGGGAVTANYGLKVGAQTVGMSNWSVRTDRGLFEIGDALRLYPVASAAKPTCVGVAGDKGKFWFTAGSAGSPDMVEVCAADAAGTLAWRVITNGQKFSCDAYQISGTNQTMTENSYTVVQFDADSGCGEMHSASVNNTRITVPTGAGGTWQFTALASFGTTITSHLTCYLKKNGGYWKAGPYLSGGAAGLGCSAIDTVAAAGDYYEFAINQSSGGDKALYSGSSRVFLSAARVGN